MHAHPTRASVETRARTAASDAAHPEKFRPSIDRACPRHESNVRPHPSDGCALNPAELRGLKKAVDPEGIEPSSPTCEAGILPMNYEPSAPGRNRTDGLW